MNDFYRNVFLKNGLLYDPRSTQYEQSPQGDDSILYVVSSLSVYHAICYYVVYTTAIETAVGNFFRLFHGCRDAIVFNSKYNLRRASINRENGCAPVFSFH